MSNPTDYFRAKKQREHQCRGQDWLIMQIELGCDLCRYADQAAMGGRACCTFAGKIGLPKDNGSCRQFQTEAQAKKQLQHLNRFLSKTFFGG